MRAQLLVRQGRIDEARSELESSVDENSHDVDSQQALCRILFEHGSVEDAERSFVRLLELEPGDSRAHNNLGMIYVRGGQFTMALDCFRESLRLRPNALLTLKHFCYTLESIGELAEARKAWERTLKSYPDDSEARSNLERLWNHTEVS